jgi:hypothetical protein
MRATSIATILALASHVLACGDDPVVPSPNLAESPRLPETHDAGAPVDAATEGDAGSALAPPTASEHATTYADVAPIFSRACLQCHSPGQIGPFAFETYDKAKPFAPLLAKAVRARTMPPSVIDASGDCNTFPEVSWLSEEEIRTVERWADQGAPDATGPLAALVPTKLPALSGDVHTIHTPSYVPKKGTGDDYRCFVIDSPFDEEAYVTGFDMHPANAQTAHHMVLFYPMDDLSAAMAGVLDSLEEGPGYTCFGGSGAPATILAAWAPGGGATNYPKNLGIHVDPGRPLVVQMHYNTAAVATPTAESTEITIATKKDGVEPAALLPMLDLDLTVPPGQASVDYVLKGKLADSIKRSGPVEVHGVFPHMHELGRSLKVTTRNGSDGERCVIDAPRYDFHWQRTYYFDEPMMIDADDPIDVRCNFDSTSRKEVTKWGESTADEMCVIGLFVKL